MMPAAAPGRDRPETLFATPEIIADRRADGSIILKSTTPLRESARCIGDWLEHWARQAPERIFLADRASGDAPWSTITYRDALKQVRSAAAWILAQGLSAERPLVILSDNSVEHALFALAAQHVGVPSAAISPAYSLMSKDFDKLRSMVELLEPGAIYVSAMKPFAAALAAIEPLHSAIDHKRRCRRYRCDLVSRYCCYTGNARCRKGVCRGHTGYDRKIPVHLGFDRYAEGRHQHPAYANFQSAGQGADLVIPRR